MKNNIIVRNSLLITSASSDELILDTFNENFPHMKVLKAATAETGIEILMHERVDVVIIEASLALRSDGFLSELGRRNIGVPVVVIIDRADGIMAAEAMRDGAYDYMVRSDDYAVALTRIIERIESTTIPVIEKRSNRGRQYLLFEQIYRSQKWWQNIIDAITDYLFVIDTKYRILRTNKAFSGLFGKEPADIIMRPYFELFGLNGPHEWCITSDSNRWSSPVSVEREINGTEYLISSFPISYDEREAAVFIMKDITETRRLKDQVYHLDKLSSIGTLTSGVAHEINNPLTGIIGYTEMMLMNDQTEGTKQQLEKVYRSALRCRDIVQNMLTFSRQSSSRNTPEDINEVIDKTIELHEYRLKSTNIEIVRNYNKLPYIEIDRQQMQQVFLNLLINAEYAVAQCGRPGRIEFRTEEDAVTGGIKVTVSDNGNGIPKEILPRIYDPFFTTKPVNKGTGLGLSITHGIVAEQGGSIDVKTIDGQGTSFTITLPMKKQSVNLS